MEEKFERIYYKYNKDIFHLIFSYTLNVAETKDILQDTFFKYYEHMNNIPDDEKIIKKWLIKVAINKTKDNFKSFWQKKIVFLENEEYNFAENNLNLELLEILGKLAKKYRLPIFLYYYEGYDIKEISLLLKISESAIKMRLLRAKEFIKKEMEE